MLLLAPLLLVAKEVQLFSGVGIYSGIFAVYFQCPSNTSKTRTANVVFCALCLLYVLSAATLALDLEAVMYDVSNNSI